MTSRARKILVALGLATAVVVLYLATGRGGGYAVDGPVVSHDAGWGLGGSGSDALIGGAVTYTDGCVLVEGLPVVWPDGYEWDEDEQAIRVATGGSATRGGSGPGGSPSPSATR